MGIHGCRITFFVVMFSITRADTTVNNNVVGINWSPFHDPDYSSTTADKVMDADFQQIKKSGFTKVRTFFSRHSGKHIAPHAYKYGMTLAMGVHIYTKESWTEKQLEAAADQAEEYPDTILAIFVGNENVRTDGTGDSASSTIALIRTMKEKLRSRSITGVKVGTVQRYTEWNSGDSAIDELAAEADIIGANLYPVYSTSNWSRNIQVLENQLNKVKANFKDSEIWVTETGFPSGGPDCSTKQELATTKTEDYFRMVKEWVQKNDHKNIFYYAYFDKKIEGESEKCSDHMGLVYAEREPKVDF